MTAVGGSVTRWLHYSKAEHEYMISWEDASEKDRLRVAIQEAGHAVAACSLGFLVQSSDVTLGRTDVSWDELDADVAVCYAPGAAAEETFYRCYRTLGVEDDKHRVDEIERLLEDQEGYSRRGFDWFVATTRMKLEPSRSVILAFARLLLDTPSVSGGKIESFIDSARKDAP